MGESVGKIKVFGVWLKTWHLYLIVPLLGLLLVGCAAGLLVVGGALMSGSSGINSTSSGSSGLKSITGQVFSQGSENSIAPVGNAKVTAYWGETRSISIQRGVIKASGGKQKETYTNSDGSYTLDDIDTGVTVDITIEKEDYTANTQEVDTSVANPEAKGIINQKNKNKKTIFKDTDTDINTAEDTNDKGEKLPECHISVPAGAVDSDMEAELTPYFSINTLPVALPDGYIGLAGADFFTSSPITFTTGKEAKPYIVLPKSVRAEELSNTNIKLMELIEVNGELRWVIVKDDAGTGDAKCKYHSTGLYNGLLGPDDDQPANKQAKLKRGRPFCYVYPVPQIATITGTIKNTSGQPIQNVMVFGGGSATTTDAQGRYTLAKVIALSTTSDSLIIVNAIAANYQLSSSIAAVRAGTITSGVDITLESLSDVAIIGGWVKDAYTNAPIGSAKVVCSTQPYSAAFTYDNKNTIDLSDDILSVTEPANVSYYRWFITPPLSVVRYQSSTQFNNSVILSSLFSEFGFGSTGAYRVDLEITLSNNKTIKVTAGFLLKLIFFQAQITDIKLATSFDSSITLEAYTNGLGNYRMIGVPSDVSLQLQVSKSGYQSSGTRTLWPLTPSQTKEENFLLYPGASTIASIWITPSPSVNVTTGQSLQFSATAKDSANNMITPTPVFTWASSNNNVATVNSVGLASAIGSGNSTIQAASSGVLSNAVMLNVVGLPSAPTNLALTAATPSDVFLTWSDNSNNEEGFKLERSTNGATYTLLATIYPNMTSFTDTGLASGITYYYRLCAYNSIGNSGFSPATGGISYQQPAPAGPSALVLNSPDANNIQLSWTDNSTNELGFQVRRSLNGDEGSFSVLALVSANTNSYNDSSVLSPKTYYYYRIYAYNDTGNSAVYASGSVQTRDVTPNPPNGLIAIAMSSSQIDLYWNDNSNNENGFTIERSTDNITFTQIATAITNSTTCSNTGLAYNTLYYYRVRAYNDAGNSNYTSIAYATTNQAVPSAPTGAALTVLSDTSIMINWADTSDNEDNFKVERSTDGSLYALRSTLNANTTVFTDTGLSASTAYWYRVYAANTIGSSGFSNVVSGTTQAPPIPTAPTNLITTTLTSSVIGLQWTDNSSTETGFKLDRSPNGVSGWVTLTTTAANVIAFSDTPLTAATTFYYRVCAYNLGGDSAYASLTAATLAVPDNLAFAVQPVNTVAGAAMTTVQVQVRDASNNPLSLNGISVTLTINKGVLSGTLSKNTVAGIATFSDLNMTLADTGYAITASSGGLTPATSNSFNITSAAADNLVWVDQPANTAAGQIMAPFTVRVRDAYANNVQGVTVSITATNSTLAVYQAGTTVAYATAASASDGLATFSAISMTAAGAGYVFRASSGTLAQVNSSGFNIAPGTANNLAFVQQPANTSAGAVMSPVTVRIKDAYNNLLAGQSISITATNGTFINGALTQPSDTNGIATFTPLSITAAAAGYVLSATSGALMVTSSAFDITSAVAYLAFTQQPSNTTAGATMASITVLVQDQFNNPQSGITVSLTTTNGTLLNGMLSRVSNGSGIATFDDLNITLANTGYVLSASATTYNTIVSTAFNITPAPANNLAFSVQPVNTVAGATLAAVKVQVRDQYNNLIPSVPVSLTAATQLNGVAAVNSDASGVASFNDLYITTTGSYQLSARANAVGPTNSNSFDITPAAIMTVVVSGDNPINSGIESSSYTAISTDAYNNNVSDSYLWSKTNGTGTATRSGDKLTGVLVGTVTITANSVSAPTKSGSQTITIIEGPVNTLSFIQQPTTATVNTAISPAVTVRVQDAAGNSISGMEIGITSGALSVGTFSRTSDSGGIAAFNDLAFAIDGNYNLMAYYNYPAVTATSTSFSILSTLPSVPSGLAAAAISPTAITLSWADNSTNEQGFKIYRFDAGDYAQIDTVASGVTVYTNTSLTENTLYYYKVKAYNAAGNSDYSGAASAMTPLAAPLAPTGLVTNTVTTSSIGLQWADNAANEEGVKLERSANGVTYSLISTLAANIISYTDSGLIENTAYWYRLYAYNAGGNSGYSNVISATTAISAPSSPISLTANAISATQLSLSWNDTSGNESGFKVERSLNGSNFSLLASLGSNITVYSDNAVTPANTYWYKIYAYNAGGNSGYSNIASAMTPDVLPNAPNVFTPTSVSAYQVVITWTDNSNNETGFKVERKTGAGSYSQIDIVAANVITYTDNTVSSYTGYYYRVRAYNAAGNSAYSGEVYVETPLPQAPTAPSALTVTAVTTSSIGLQWIDNSTNEESFKLERSTDGTNYALRSTLNVNTITATDSGLSANTTYWYRVYAYNVGGPSTYTNIVFANTSGTPPITPTNLISTTVTASSIGIQWQDNSTDETSFRVERATVPTAMDDYVWVANYNSTTVTRIKKSDSTLTNITSGSYPYGVAIDETYCWVPNRLSNTVTRVRKSDLTTTTITAGSMPEGIAVDDTYCWVSNRNSNNVVRILKSNPAITTTIAIGVQPWGVAVDSIYVWVANNGGGNGNTVTRIRKSDLAMNNITVGSSPAGVAVDGTYVWVANLSSNTVTRILKSDLTTTTIAVGSSPRGIAVDGTYCWVANRNSDTVTRILKSDTAVTTTITVGLGPTGIAVDGTYCWVANSNANTVTRILKSDLSKVNITVGLAHISIGDMTGWAYDNYAIWSQAAELSANTTVFNNSSLSPTTTYYYRVYAANSAGNSGYSNVISATTSAPPPPDAPSGLNASINSISSTNLTWQDNSGDETSFKIERSLDGNSWTVTYTLGANTTAYLDTGLSLGVTYYYRVKASNANGDSAPSGVAQCAITVQSDSMICLGSDADILANYIGDNVYETTPITQTKSVGVLNSQTVSYLIRIYNDGTIAESFKITGTPGNANWAVTYYNGSTGGSDITSSVTGSGFNTSAIGSGGYYILRAEVRPISASNGALFDAFITAKSNNDPYKQDTIKARTSVGAVDDYVWVTNYGSSNVSRIKRSDSSTANITAGNGTRGVAVDESYCWVVNSGANNVSRVKKSDLTAVTIAAGTSPLGIAVDEAYAWVANYSSNNVTRINKADSSTTSIAVGTNPAGVAVDGTYVWVANSGSSSVTRILKSDSTKTTISVGSGPSGIAVDATYCWVANSSSNNVTRINKADSTKTTISTGSLPSGVAVDETYCWVSNNGSNNVTRIKKSDLTTTTVAVGSAPNGVSVDGAYVWVANYGGGSGNTVTRILKSNSSTINITVGTGPLSLGDMTGYAYDNYATILVTAVDDYVWVANKNSNNVFRISKSDSTTTTIAVGTNPYGVAVDANYVWVANFDSNNVTRIKKSDLSTTNIAVGTSPIAVAVDETYCWVTNYSSNTLTRILKSNLTTTTIAVGNSPHGVAVDANYVWVANFSSFSVSRILKSNPAISTTIASIGQVIGIAVDETYCWVAKGGSGNVTRILKSDLSTTTIAVGTSLYGVAVDANYVWVTNATSNAVTRILKSNPTITTTIAVGTSPAGVAVDGTYCWVLNNEYSGNVTRILKSDLSTTTIAVGHYPYYSLGDMTGYAYDNYNNQ